MPARRDGRNDDQLRPIRVVRGFTRAAPGSVLIQAGRTQVLCTASVEAKVPAWMTGAGRGWMTAEYNMLPGSTAPRKARERDGKLDGRTSEIQRLIGRSLRAVADLDALGERTLAIDCDVLEADGGTRTLSITGAVIAVLDALAAIRNDLPDPARFPLTDAVAAVSVGLVDGRPVLDLDYSEDVAAEVDMNVVMTRSGRYVEIQGTGEEATFDEPQLAAMLALARRGMDKLFDVQRKALADVWPFAHA